MRDITMYVEMPRCLMELLYLRSSWALLVADDVPAVVRSSSPSLPPRPVDELTEKWRSLWEVSIHGLAMNSHPRTWAAIHGTAGFDPFALSAWEYEHFQRFTYAEVDFPHRPPPSPEQRVGAVAASLRMVYVLPLAGYYFRRLSPTTVLVDEATRRSPERYRAALMT